MASEAPIEHDPRWPVVSLADIATKIGSGATPKGGADAYLPTRVGFALVRSQNVFDRRFDHTGLAFITDEQADGLRGVVLQARDILLNITGDGITFGRACMVPTDVFPACVNQHVSIVRVDPRRADAGYVLAFLTRPEVKQYIESFNAGGSRRAVTKGHIESFRLPLPPLSEQRAIAHILGTLDDKIELNRRMSETLEAMARALFKSWFVDFDPVRAKAEGWKFEEMGKHVESSRGFSYDGASIAEGGVPFHNLNSIFEGGGYKFEGIKSLSGEFDDRRAVEPGDVIVANTEQGHNRLLLGSAALIPQRYGPRTPFSHHLYRVRVRPASPLCPVYVLHLLNDPWMHDLVSRYGNGTTVNMLPTDALELPRIAVPPASLVARFEAVVLPLHHRTEAAVVECESLAALRDTLLPKLISGALRVRGLKKTIPGDGQREVDCDARMQP